MASPTVVVKEMGISHADFFRILPAALGDDNFRIDGTRVERHLEGRSLEISLGPERQRRIAALALPVTSVRLAFHGYDEAAIALVLARFDRYFQRGGG